MYPSPREDWRVATPVRVCGMPPRAARTRNPSRTRRQRAPPAAADGEARQASIDRRAQSLHGPGHLEPFQPRKKVAKDRLELGASNVCAHAEVFTDPEG